MLKLNIYVDKIGKFFKRADLRGLNKWTTNPVFGINKLEDEKCIKNYLYQKMN